MSDIVSRLKYVRELNGLSQAKFASEIGVSQGNVGDWERGRSLPSTTALISISQKFKVSLDWLLTGEETFPKIIKGMKIETLISAMNSMEKQEQDELLWYAACILNRDKQKSAKEFLEEAIHKRDYGYFNTPEPTEIKESQTQYIPILGYAAAGLPIMAEELIDGVIPVPKELAKEKVFFIKIRGDSMVEAGINDGDLVLIRPQPTVENNEIALVKYNGEVTVKRFVNENNCIRLRSANPGYKDIIIKNMETVRVLGKVIKTIPREEANQLTKPLFE